MFLSFVILSVVLQINTALHNEAKKVPVSDRISFLKFQLQEQLRDKFIDKGHNPDYLEVLDIENPKVINANADYLDNSKLPITPIMNSDEERFQHHAELLPKLATPRTIPRRTRPTKRTRTTTTEGPTTSKKKKRKSQPTTKYTYTTTTLPLRFQTVTPTTTKLSTTTTKATTTTKRTTTESTTTTELTTPEVVTPRKILTTEHADTTTGALLIEMVNVSPDDGVSEDLHADPLRSQAQVTHMINEWRDPEEPYSEDEQSLPIAVTPETTTPPSPATKRKTPEVELPIVTPPIPFQKPLKIFYSIFSKYRRLTDEKTRNLPLRWVHCQDMVTPYLTGRLKQSDVQTKLLGPRHNTVRRLAHLFSVNTTYLSYHEKFSLVGRINEIQIRLFQWETKALRLLLNIICKNKRHSFKLMKRGLVDLFASWDMKSMNVSNLLASSKIIRPPCINVHGFDGSTKSPKRTTYTTLDQETSTSSKCADDDDDKEGI